MDIRQRLEADRTLDRLLEAYNRHDVEAVVACFMPEGAVNDEAWIETHGGLEAIRAHYQHDFEASPDITLRTLARYYGDDSAVVRLEVRGTHQGEWRGMPATGNAFEFDCFTTCRFSPRGDSLTTLALAYDRARILGQLGLLHDPASTLGKALTAITHPVTMAKAARRRISNRPPPPGH